MICSREENLRCLHFLTKDSVLAIMARDEFDPKTSGLLKHPYNCFLREEIEIKAQTKIDPTVAERLRSCKLLELIKEPLR